jgi:hypothetical protein
MFMKNDAETPDVFPHFDYKPKLPQHLDHGIGIVGAGGIVNYAHLAGEPPLCEDPASEV